MRPTSWPPDRSEGPATSVFIRGQEAVDGKEVPVDVAISVTRIPRLAKFFASEKAYDDFRRKNLLQIDALFGPPDPELESSLRDRIAKETLDVNIAGITGKAYRRDYDYLDPANPKAKAFPLALEDAVLRTSEVYYVLEYRARRDLFDKYHFAGARLWATFQPGQYTSDPDQPSHYMTDAEIKALLLGRTVY